jgi:hypothetical protein
LKCGVSFTSYLFNHQGKSVQFPLDRRFYEPQSLFGRCEVDKYLLLFSRDTKRYQEDKIDLTEIDKKIHSKMDKIQDICAMSLWNVETMLE